MPGTMPLWSLLGRFGVKHHVGSADTCTHCLQKYSRDWYKSMMVCDLCVDVSVTISDPLYHFALSNIITQSNIGNNGSVHTHHIVYTRITLPIEKSYLLNKVTLSMITFILRKYLPLSKSMTILSEDEKIRNSCFFQCTF